MSKIKAAFLIATMIAYDGLIVFMLWFTVAFSGAKNVFVPSIGMLTFWAVAISPIAVTYYCVVKLQAIRRGENPRI